MMQLQPLFALLLCAGAVTVAGEQSLDIDALTAALVASGCDPELCAETAANGGFVCNGSTNLFSAGDYQCRGNALFDFVTIWPGKGGRQPPNLTGVLNTTAFLQGHFSKLRFSLCVLAACALLCCWLL